MRDALLYGMLDRDRYWARVEHLIEARKMTLRAARVVVDAAMYGEGCVEGEVRDRIQKEQDDFNGGGKATGRT